MHVSAIEPLRTSTGIAGGPDRESKLLISATHTKNMPITLLLADDTEFMRKGIRRLLESDSEIEIVGEAASFDQTVKMIAALKPQVVVMDLHMPSVSGITPAALKSCLASSGSQLLAISIWDDEDSKALAMTFGSVTLLDKRDLSTELIPAIRRIQL